MGWKKKALRRLLAGQEVMIDQLSGIGVVMADLQQAVSDLQDAVSELTSGSVAQLQAALAQTRADLDAARADDVTDEAEKAELADKVAVSLQAAQDAADQIESQVAQIRSVSAQVPGDGSGPVDPTV